MFLYNLYKPAREGRLLYTYYIPIIYLDSELHYIPHPNIDSWVYNRYIIGMCRFCYHFVTKTLASNKNYAYLCSE